MYIIENIASEKCINLLLYIYVIYSIIIQAISMIINDRISLFVISVQLYTLLIF